MMKNSKNDCLPFSNSGRAGSPLPAAIAEKGAHGLRYIANGLTRPAEVSHCRNGSFIDTRTTAL